MLCVSRHVGSQAVRVATREMIEQSVHDQIRKRMEYPQVLDLCLNAGLRFLAEQPLALLLETPLRLSMQTALLNAGLELEVAVVDDRSEFLRLEGGRLIVRVGTSTNNIFPTQETSDIRVTANESEFGYSFELKASGSHGTNKNLSIGWMDDVDRVFETHVPKRYAGNTAEETIGKVEGAILAASRKSYERLSKQTAGLLPSFDELPLGQLKTFQAEFEGTRQAFVRGGRCVSYGDERCIVCVTRLFYLPDEWRHH